MPDASPGRPVTVLSIDGGGIRGLIPALVLAELEERAGRPLWQLFDLVAGTSSGGLLALGLATPAPAASERRARYTARELAALYDEEGPRIFDRSLWRHVRTAAGLLEEKYPDDGLEAVLEDYFGDVRLADALTEVLAPAYALEWREAYFFKRHAARDRPRGRNALMRHAARATSAAPTYFEPARVNVGTGVATSLALIDGGVYAGNPAMCAYAEAVAHFGPGEAALGEEALGKGPPGRVPRVLVVSLGTGADEEPVRYHDAKGWGAAGWARPVIDVALHGARDTVDYQLRHLLPPGRYHRFEPRLTEASGALDDASAANRHALRRDARRLVKRRAADLDALAARLAERVDV